MRPLLILCILTLTILGCAKKSIPAASANTTTAPAAQAPETKAPDNAKIDPAALGEETAFVVAGHKTFDAKCGRCHGLKDPADFTAKQWVPIMNNMALKARLDSTEKANVSAYVSFHAKKE